MVPTAASGRAPTTRAIPGRSVAAPRAMLHRDDVPIWSGSRTEGVLRAGAGAGAGVPPALMGAGGGIPPALAGAEGCGGAANEGGCTGRLILRPRVSGGIARCRVHAAAL